MPDENKKYLIQIESNLDKYIKESVEAKKRVDELKAANAELIKSGTATAEQIQQSNASLRNAQTEYKNSTKLVDLATQANRANAGSYEQLYRNWQLAQTELKLLSNTIETDAQGVQHLSAAYIQQSQVVANAKKALNDFGAGVHDNRLNVGSYSEAIDGAIIKFQQMPGPVGQASRAVHGVTAAFKIFLANPVVAAISAIIAVIVGLVKVFKSTAEGSGKMKDTLASIGAILNELRARVISFIDIFSHIFKGEWKEAGEAARETFAGLGKSLHDASVAAAELSKQQRELAKEISMRISEEAEEQNMIQKYIFYSKDRMKTDQERMDYLKQAIELSKENAENEVEYAKRQFDIDIGNAANKAKIDQKTLSDWINMNAMQQQLALETSTELQKAYNLLGVEGMKALEESRAKISQADTAFFESNKRTISQYTGLVEEIKTKRLNAQREIAQLMTLEAGGDPEKLRAALKKQLDADLQESQITNTKKLLLHKKYLEDVEKIDREFALKNLDLYTKQQKLILDADIAALNNRKVALKNAYEAKTALESSSYIDRAAARLKYEQDNITIDQQIIDRQKQAIIAQRDLQIAQIDTLKQLPVIAAAERILIEDTANQAILQLDRDFLNKKQELAMQDLEAGQAAFDKEQQTRFEWERLRVDNMMTSGTERLNALNTILDAEYQATVASNEYKNASAAQQLLVDEQYTAAKKELAEARIQQSYDEAQAVAGALGAMSEVVGKQTVLGKAFAIAEATINTWVAASKALTDPTIPSTILRIAMMATAIATGLMTVKKIVEVKVPGKGGGGEAVASSWTPPTSLTASSAAQRAFAPSVGSTLLTQLQLSQGQVNALPNQGIITAEQLAAAVAKLPAPIVTVEDINARTAASRKVEVRGNV
jgi:hypothetical protein